ncbi:MULTISPECIES: hypothetical protein [unclassified Streptomyces]|uniref:hypothetical protein n=1 Tax=unclassified Streptomyces TaxID=2593676 RepID=UPI00365A7FAE
MRAVFALDAVVLMDAGADARAPGAAVTVALCGHWEHEPPCPLAPHHTTADHDRGEVRLRVLFAAEPEAEEEVRGRIRAALHQGRLDGPDGVTVCWQLRGVNPSEVRHDEQEQARRLAHS